MIALMTPTRRATICYVCGRQLEGGIRPNRYGVCLGEEAFSIHAERFIREHNAVLDLQDTTPLGACVDSGRLTPDQAASTRALRTGKNNSEVL